MARPGDTTQVQGAPQGENTRLQELRDATHQGAMDAAAQTDLGGMPGLTDPTQRPNEPLTAGLSSGAGPGPEAIDQSFINTINTMGATPDAELYADSMPWLEAMAAQPGTTTETRNWVRKLRSQAAPRI